MKKISTLKLVLLLIGLSGSIFSYAQFSNDIASLEIPKNRIPAAFTADAPATSAAEKAVLVFNSMFTNTANVTWSTYRKNLPFVYFETPGKINRAGFDKNGKLVYTLSYYKEEQLPVTILLKVKETYYGRNIHSVNEVNYAGKTAYIIMLEDKTTWLQIKIVGDEMEEEKLMIKG